MAGHPIVHVEIASKDFKASSKFYSEVFGWKPHVAEEFDYYMFESEGGPGGGFVKQQAGLEDTPVLIYIGTDDVEASLAEVEAHGGKVMVPKTEIPGTGWFAIFTDPSGTKVALYKALQQ